MNNRIFNVSEGISFGEFVNNVAMSHPETGKAYMGKVSFSDGLPGGYSEGTMTVTVLSDGLVKYTFNSVVSPYSQYECYSVNGGEPTVWSGGNEIKWYGIEVDELNLDPVKAVSRIGNFDLHRELPVQNSIRRCILGSDGNVVYYLHAENSSLKEDGTPAVLDGTDGDVMVEMPEHFIKVEKVENGIQSLLRVKMSDTAGAIEGAVRIPLHYISAFHVSLSRDNSKLCSASGVLPTTVNDYCDSVFSGNLVDYFKNLAGIDNSEYFCRFRHSIRDTRGEGWNLYTYDDFVDLYWLYLVEYANRDAMADFTSELTSEGFHQGGLGRGATYSGVVGLSDILISGLTLELGNSSGDLVYYYGGNDFPSTNPEEFIPKNEFHINSYRGVECPFGRLSTMLDGAFISKGTHLDLDGNLMWRCSKRTLPDVMLINKIVQENYYYTTSSLYAGSIINLSEEYGTNNFPYIYYTNETDYTNRTGLDGEELYKTAFENFCYEQNLTPLPYYLDVILTGEHEGNKENVRLYKSVSTLGSIIGSLDYEIPMRMLPNKCIAYCSTKYIGYDLCLMYCGAPIQKTEELYNDMSGFMSVVFENTCNSLYTHIKYLGSRMVYHTEDTQIPTN